MGLLNPRSLETPTADRMMLAHPDVPRLVRRFPFA